MTQQSPNKISSFAAYKLLMKVRIQSIFASMGFYSKNKGGAAALTILSSIKTILIALSVMFLCSLLGWLFAFVAPEFTPDLIVCLSAAVSLIFTVVQAGGTLFGQRDLDFRMALPISTKVMTISQISAFYIYQIICSIVVMLPMYISYVSLVPSTPIQILFMLLTIILTPLIPVSIGILFAYVLSLFSSRFKYSSIVYIVLGIAASILVYVFFMAMSIESKSSTGLESSFLVSTFVGMANMASSYFPASWASAAIRGNAISGVLFVVISLAIPFVAIEIFSRIYLKINSILTSRNSSKTTELNLSSTRSNAPLKAMVKMEFKRILSIPQYAINFMIGDALVIIIAIVVSALGLDAVLNGVVVSYLGLAASDAQIVIHYINLALPWVFAFFCAMSSTASCSISIEGLNAWIMVSAPLSTKDILKSKIVANIIHVGASVVISSVILLIFGIINPLCAIEIILLSCSLAFINSCLGIMFDSKSPKYTWVKASDVINRGKGVMAVSIAGLVETMVGVILMIVITVAAGPIAGEVVTVLFGLLSIFGGLKILKHACRRPIYSC